jgi:hypothetical protein
MHFLLVIAYITLGWDMLPEDGHYSIPALRTFIFFRKLPQLTGYLFSITITTFAIFLFGKQGFCNYYYLVSVLMLFLMAQTFQSKQKV